MTRRNAKVGSPELEDATIDVMRKAAMPVSMQYIADRVDVAWHQARSQLFLLALEGKIIAVNTTKSWVFTIKPDTPEAKPVSAQIALHNHKDTVVTSTTADAHTSEEEVKAT